MTQIKKALEEAVKDATCKNFEKTFRIILEQLGEQALIRELSKHDFPVVTVQNINALIPEESLKKLAQCVEDAIETLAEEIYTQSKLTNEETPVIISFQKEINKLENKDFADARDKVIADWIEAKGSPTKLFGTVAKIFETLYAQTLLKLLIEDAPKLKSKAFLPLVETLSDQASRQAMATILEQSRKAPYPPFGKTFAKTFTDELITRYRSKGKKHALKNVNKIVFSAFINHY